MTFARPLLLAALILVPVLLVAYVAWERRPHRFAPAALMPSVLRRKSGWLRHATLVGYAAAILALIVALAKPTVTTAVATEQARVMILTDRSGSMAATDIKPNRLTAAKRAAQSFLNSVPDSVRVGAITFNQSADVLQSPTTDHEAVAQAINAITAGGTTATGDALTAALNDLKGNAPAAIVLLSDGKSVRGSDPLTVAQQAKARHIPIYTVALGTASGTINNGKDAVPPDPQTMQQIAKLTGGQSFAATDLSSLDQVYKKLGSQVATTKKKVEVSNFFAGGALALMALSALGSVRTFGRLI